MQPLSLHHLHLPGTFGTSLRYFANVAITAQCPFGCFPTRVGIFTAILGCAVLRLEKRCLAFAAADFGCLQLGLVGTFAAGILVLTVGPPTNLTLVAEQLPGPWSFGSWTTSSTGTWLWSASERTPGRALPFDQP